MVVFYDSRIFIYRYVYLPLHQNWKFLSSNQPLENLINDDVDDDNDDYDNDGDDDDNNNDDDDNDNDNLLIILDLSSLRALHGQIRLKNDSVIHIMNF
jgi:hypothetical protein